MGLTRLLALAQGIVTALILVIADLCIGEGTQLRPTSALFFIPVVTAAVLVGVGMAKWFERHAQHLTRTAMAARATSDASWPALPSAAPRQFTELNRALKEMHHRSRSAIGELVTERTRHREILDSITEAILVTDDEGRILLTNRAFDLLFGTGESGVGRRPVELIRNVTVCETVDEVLATHQHVSREAILRGPSIRNLDVQVAPILDEGHFVGTVTVLYEITRLRRLERTRVDFVANVSHELRTPLTAIKGCAETLADGALADAEAAARFVEVIGSHAERLTILLNDLLDLSRLESDELQIDRQAQPLKRLIDAARDTVRKATTDKEITVHLDLPDPEVAVMCDRRLVEQALLNLIDNAVKYTSQGGDVTIRARRLSREAAMVELASRDFSAGGVEDFGDNRGGQPDVLVIEVIDDGIGIPTNAIDRVFERFYRVDKGRSREIGGTGLGLSLVRHTIALHGERVFVDSELGRGSTFGFTLPVA